MERFTNGRRLRVIKKLLLIISVLINISFLYCEDWTLGATPFTITESSLITDSEKSGLDIIATQIPSLILDSFPINIKRTVFPEEQFERELFKIKKERQSLYSSLTNQIKTRDSLFLSYSGIELKKKIESSDKTVESTIKKIDELQKKEDELIENFNLDKKKKNTIEKVVLYQNDSTKLYSLEDSYSKDKINSSSIHGLITGNVTPYGNYVKVESVLTLYPEGKVLISAREVGLVSEVEFIASSIMNQMLSSIINSSLVETDILIYPQEAGENATVYIEDFVLKGKSISTQFTPGEHSIRVESPGYETIYFSYNYSSEENKTIAINMKKIESVESYFTIDSKNNNQFDLSSQIYLNSLYQGMSPVSVLISDKTYIGEVVSKKDDDVYSFFVLKNGYNSKNLKQEKRKNKEDAVALQVALPEAKEDLSKRIDKSRKRMYWSYGGLILSLPLHYFAKGTYELCQENSLIIDSSKMQTWKTASDITMYAVIGTGVNFLVQLILYLVDTNKVVPKIIEPSLIDANDVENLNAEIQEVRQKEEQLKVQQELEQQKKLEEEKKLAEENSERENISSEIENENSQNENTNSKEGE
jgi:hypothetical protein